MISIILSVTVTLSFESWKPKLRLAWDYNVALIDGAFHITGIFLRKATLCPSDNQIGHEGEYASGVDNIKLVTPSNTPAVVKLL